MKKPHGRFHQTPVVQLPASILLAPQSLAGSVAQPDFRAQSVTVTQANPTLAALTINSASLAYSQDLVDVNDAAGVRLVSMNNAGVVSVATHVIMAGIGTPGPATAGAIRMFAGASGSVRHLMFEDENGVVYDLGSGIGKPGSVFALTDAATVATDASKGSIFTLSTNAARTMGAPTNLFAGQVLSYDMLNNGGSGALTWNAVFQLAGAWTDPANGKRRTITFYSPDGTNLRELSRAAADI